MTNLNLIILSYHQFYSAKNEYQYSRTINQFRNDLETKVFDWISIDDAHWSCLYAFDILKAKNHRAILFVPTSLIGQDGYLTWKQINDISKHHEIGNHSHNHVNLRDLSIEDIQEQMLTSNMLIEKHIGKKPRFFVPPFNKCNKHVDNIAEKLGLQVIKNRINILNTSE